MRDASAWSSWSPDMTDTPKRGPGRPLGSGKGRDPELRISVDADLHARLSLKPKHELREWLRQMP